MNRNSLCFAGLCALIVFLVMIAASTAKGIYPSDYGGRLWGLIALSLGVTSVTAFGTALFVWRTKGDSVITPAGGIKRGLSVAAVLSALWGIVVNFPSLNRAVGGFDNAAYNSAIMLTSILVPLVWGFVILAPFMAAFGALCGQAAKDDVLNKRFAVSSHRNIFYGLAASVMIYGLWILAYLFVFIFIINSALFGLYIFGYANQMFSFPALWKSIVEDTFAVALVLMALAWAYFWFRGRAGWNRRIWIKSACIAAMTAPIGYAFIDLIFNRSLISYMSLISPHSLALLLVISWFGIVCGGPIGALVGHSIGSRVETKAWVDQLEREAAENNIP